ncbi:MAG: glycosyltransferase family 4 protein, partial [Firmicutes bacterium]|nr:glycosyltransferase family 4 protein [Bacillota bacterium]
MEYKYRRNAELLEKELEQDPENIYYWFQLSQTHAMYKQHQEGLKAIEKAYDVMITRGKSDYRMFVFISLAKSCCANKMYRKAIEICDQACAFREGYFDLYYYRGVSCLNLGNYEDALSSFLQYLEAVEKFNRGEGLVDLSITYGTPAFYENVLQYICVIYKRQEQYDLALEYAERITDKEIYQGVIPLVVEIYRERESFAELKSLCQNKVAEFPELRDSFLSAFEQQWLTMTTEEKKTWVRLYANEPSDYGLLNRLRLLDEADSYLSDQLIAEVEALNLQELPTFYGDILWIWLKRDRSILPLIQGVSEAKLNGFLMYLAADQQRDYSTMLVDYLQKQNLWTSSLEPTALRIQVFLLRSILVVNGLPDDVYESAFSIYAQSGIQYLQTLYHPEIIEQEKVEFMKTEPDAFLLYMLKADKCYESDKAKYARYLRQALHYDNSMKRGIEILQNQLSENLDSQRKEFEAHRQHVLEAIESCISSGEFEAAKMLIAEYEDIVGIDAKICSARAIILLAEQRLDEAREVLLDGLGLEPSNEDLLFNMGYLCELNNEVSEAIRFYSLAKSRSVDADLVSDANDAISRLWNEAVPAMRKGEFKRRLSQIGSAKKQVLVQRTSLTDCIHVAYVMAHVGVCGGSKIIFEHANRLTLLGVKVTIICHFPKPQWFPILCEYIEVPFEKELAGGIPECDVIVATYWDHIQECIDAQIAPVVYFEQGDSHLYDTAGLSPKIEEFIARQYELAPFVMTVSNQTAAVIKDRFRREARVFPNSIDESIFHAGHSRPIVEYPYILMLGSGDIAFKGIKDIVEAYRLFCTSLEPTNRVGLIWITPTQPSRVSKEVSEVFVSPSQGTIGDLYRGALMYVSGSHYESFSLPPLEAMACGCPVITTDNVGVREYAKDGVNALICSIKKPRELAEAMGLVYADKLLRDRLVNNGLATAEQYKWSEIIPDIKSYYEEISRLEISG